MSILTSFTLLTSLALWGTEAQLKTTPEMITRQVDAARRGLEQCTGGLESAFGAPLGLCKSDIMWAFGQVISPRCRHQNVYRCHVANSL
jgi:hypothetical protein